MRERIFAFLAASALLLNIVGLAAADTNGGKTEKRQGSQLVALLPASDGVATFDARRFTNALPQLLGKNPSLLAKITGHLSEIQNKTGIDLSKFDSVVVGTTIVKADAKKFTMDPVVIARGTIKVDSLLAGSKLAAKDAYREEKVGTRTVYVFSTKTATQKAGAVAGQAAAVVGNALGSMPSEIAVSALDENTIVIGSLGRVRQTLDGTTHVSPEVTSLLSSNGSSVMAFAVKAPNGLSSVLPLENDELGNSIDSIQYVSGTVDVTSAGAVVQVLARTLKPEQAKSLYDTIDGLKMLGKAFLGGSKRADQQIYARLIDNAKLAVKANVVSLDILVPQADIDVMLASVK
jgi:hypothetical protein